MSCRKRDQSLIHHLAERVLKGKLTPEKACEQVVTRKVLAQFDDTAINQLDDEIRTLAATNPSQATVLAVLNGHVARHKGNDIVWGHCNFTLGWLYLQRGELELALQHYLEVLRVFEPIPEAQETVARIRCDMAEIMERQDHLEAAVKQYEEVLALAKKLGLSHLACDAQNGLGRVCLAKGQAEAALCAFQEALRLSQDSGDKRGEETSKGNIGLTCHFLGRLDEAERNFRQAITLSHEIGHHAGTGRHLKHLGDVLIERGLLDEAETCLLKALDIARQRGDREGEQQRLGSLGNLYQAWARREADPQRRETFLNQAETNHREALAIARERNDRRGMAIHLLNLGRVRTSQEHFGTAETCFVEALGLAKELGQSGVDTQWRVRYAWGNLCTAQQRDRLAFDYYTTGIEIVEEQRLALKSTDLRSAFWQERTALYKQMALCCLRLGKLWPALIYTERSKARYLADLLAQPGSLTDDSQHVVQATLKALPLHTAVVIFNVTEAGTVVFIVTDRPGGNEDIPPGHDWQQSSDRRIRARLVDGFDQDALQHLLVEVNNSGEIVGGYLGDYYTKYTRWQKCTLESVSTEIYESLLALVDQELTRLQVERIVFMPNLGLSLLPLHACGTEQGCLLDRYEIMYVPSFGVLRHCLEKAPPTLPREGSLLAVSNPTNDLAWADMEVERIADLFSKAKILKGGKKDRATPDAIITEATDYTVVHFACHGMFDMPDFLQSYLKLASSKKLTLEMILERLRLSGTYLVVMSACETGLVDPADLADEYIGLPGGFVLAGAPRVVSTLWRANDLATALLMERFYINLLCSGMDFAAALRRAQRWLRDVTAEELLDYFEHHHALHKARREAERERMPEEVAAAGVSRFAWQDPEEQPFADPYYWAPFIFVGV